VAYPCKPKRAHIDACLFERNDFVRRVLFTMVKIRLPRGIRQEFLSGNSQMKLKERTWYRARRAHSLQKHGRDSRVYTSGCHPGLDMSGDSSKAAREGFAAEFASLLLVHRDPQVGRKWSCIADFSKIAFYGRQYRIPWRFKQS